MIKADIHFSFCCLTLVTNLFRCNLQLCSQSMKQCNKYGECQSLSSALYQSRSRIVPLRQLKRAVQSTATHRSVLHERMVVCGCTDVFNTCRTIKSAFPFPPFSFFTPDLRAHLQSCEVLHDAKWAIPPER